MSTTVLLLPFTHGIDDRAVSIALTLAQQRDATLVVLDGDPTPDISNLEYTSPVTLRGEGISHSEVLNQDKH